MKISALKLLVKYMALQRQLHDCIIKRKLFGTKLTEAKTEKAREEVLCASSVYVTKWDWEGNMGVCGNSFR